MPSEVMRDPDLARPRCSRRARRSACSASAAPRAPSSRHAPPGARAASARARTRAATKNALSAISSAVRNEQQRGHRGAACEPLLRGRSSGTSRICREASSARPRRLGAAPSRLGVLDAGRPTGPSSSRRHSLTGCHACLRCGSSASCRTPPSCCSRSGSATRSSPSPTSATTREAAATLPHVTRDVLPAGPERRPRSTRPCASAPSAARRSTSSTPSACASSSPT